MPGWQAARPATDPGSGPLCRPEHRSGTRIRPRECLSAASCARPRGPREAQGTRRGRQRGGLSFGYFSLAGQRKVSRPAGAEESAAPAHPVARTQAPRAVIRETRLSPGCAPLHPGYGVSCESLAVHWIRAFRVVRGALVVFLMGTLRFAYPTRGERVGTHSAPSNPSCRQASNRVTATALDRLRLRLPGRMGRRKRRSRGRASSRACGRPRVSGPNRKASPGR